MKEKLKILRGKMKVWNKESFRDLNQRRKEIVARINELEILEETFGLDEEESSKMKELMAEFWSVANMFESLQCQKSRSK